ncbi:unnamed protein product [Heterosigma akashiwo]
MASLGQHPFVVRLHFAIKQGGHVYLIMDFAAGGDLYSLLRKHCVRRSRGVLFYALEVALALEHCRGGASLTATSSGERPRRARQPRSPRGLRPRRRLQRGCSAPAPSAGPEVSRPLRC